MPLPSEDQIQRALVLWFDGEQRRDGTWKLMPAGLPGVVCWHTPNGGSRNAAEGAHFKRIGVKAGIPDLLFLWGILHCLELKSARGSLSDAQIAMHPRLVAAGALVATVDSLAAAKAQVIAWGLAR